jgi:hypothetical protein
MATESKKHHYIPQAVLRNFQNESGYLYVLDKATEKVHKSTALNAGHENNFNTVELHGERINLEQLFQKSDAALGRILNKFKTFTKTWELTEEDITDLHEAVIYQMFRTNSSRLSMLQFSDILRDFIGPWVEPDLIPAMGPEDAKFASLSRIEEHLKLKTHLSDRKLVVVKAPKGSSFWTSDNPVVFFNIHKDRRRALKIPGTDVFMPLSKDLLVSFMCETTYDNVRRNVEIHRKHKVPIDDASLSFFKAVEDRELVEVLPDNVVHYNWLQVTDSTRFLYSSTDDFSMALDVIKENPELNEAKGIFSTD